jgi:hypothetical protein
MSTCSDDERKNRKRTRRNAIRPNSNEAEQLKEFAVTYQMNTIHIDMVPSSPESQHTENEQSEAVAEGRRNLSSLSAESDFGEAISPPKKARSNNSNTSTRISINANDEKEESLPLTSEQSSDEQKQCADVDATSKDDDTVSSSSQPKI